MKKIGELLQALQDLNLDRIVKDSQYDDYSDLSGLEIDFKNPEERLLWDELRGVMEKVSDLNYLIKYLSTPIKCEGILHVNQNGRYETEHGDYYTSGSSIEVYLYDRFDDVWKWVISSVEHNDNGYYIVNYPNVNMEGLKVRRRRKDFF